MSELHQKVRVRFAPSPTGRLHVGNLRTALYNWLFARGQGGRFILRIEDTDLARSRTDYEQQIYEDLNWFGLDWDEGPDIGGEWGPYRQSERRAIYQRYLNRLLQSERVYYCFCSSAELEAERHRAREAGRTYTYSGKCRRLPQDEVRKRKEEGQPFTLRFNVRSGNIGWLDMVRGRVEWRADLLGDFVIMKSDGWPLYNFAVVIDDISMEISHVIRGDGHLSNTPRQLVLYEALGEVAPQFGHLSTILGPDGSKLSKRHGATSIAEFQQEGYLPEALFNFLALLGWSPEGGRELLSQQELIREFSVSRLVKAPAMFDVGKLNWMNHQYIAHSDADRLLERVTGYLRSVHRLGPDPLDEPVKQWIGLVIEAVATRLDTLRQVIAETDVVFQYDLDGAVERGDLQEIGQDSGSIELLRAFMVHWQSALAAGDVSTDLDTIRLGRAARSDMSEDGRREDMGEGAKTIKELQGILAEMFQQVTRDVKQQTGRKGKALFHPIRLALTARPSGAELVKLVPIFELGSHLHLPVPGVSERVRAFLDRVERTNPPSVK